MHMRWQYTRPLHKSDMKTFKQYLTEEQNFKDLWKPLQGEELKKEFDPKGGEIASQLKVYDAGKMKISPPEAVMDGMRILHKDPELLQKLLTHRLEFEYYDIFSRPHFDSSE